MIPTNKEVSLVVTQCLGRQFHLGMLYDCRKDHLIPNVTLWSDDTFQKAYNTNSEEASNFDIISKDTLSNKMSKVGISTDLQLSIIGNLVKVSKSAEYLQDHKSSQRIAQVTLRYKYTSKFEQLAMEQLQYPDVYIEGTPTHVVIGVLYGGEAFFVFEREVSQEENIDNVHSRMEKLVCKLPDVAGVRVSTKLNDEEMSFIRNLQCKFYCDCVLQEAPTTFQDAVKVYKQLPKLLSANPIPKIAWLHPLSNLDKRRAQVTLVQGVNLDLVAQIEELFDSFHDLQIASNEILNYDIYKYFPNIQQQTIFLKSSIKKYKLKFTEDLAVLLPQIRGGIRKETELTGLLVKHKASPFNIIALTSWLDKKKREADVLSQILIKIQEIPGRRFNQSINQ